MIVGLGTDLVDTRRIARELARGRWLASDGVFTREEIAYCSASRHPERRYAKCFAAKEATLKALGMAVPDLGAFREVEVRASARGVEIALRHRVEAAAKDLRACRIHLTVAAAGKRVAAMVILESDSRRPV